MTLDRFNLILGLLFAAVLAVVALMSVDHSRPNYQVIIGDDMTYSPAYTSFEANPSFANGHTLQGPVPGTIARGEQLFPYQPTPQDAIRAGDEWTDPIDPATEQGLASVERGTITFQTFCVSCHGGDGTGNGPVATRGFPPPPSLLTGKSTEMKDGQLFHILTHGQNSMPSFAAQLTFERRWDVINHIRRIQREAQAAAAETPAASNGAVEADSASMQDASRTLPPDAIAAPRSDMKAIP
jgi:mono/diheme cytochrome c family protein